MVNQVVDGGGSWFASPSGQWCILDVQQLKSLVSQHQNVPPDDPGDPAGWLGGVDAQGQPLVGPLTVEVWGFDSV